MSKALIVKLAPGPYQNRWLSVVADVSPGRSKPSSSTPPPTFFLASTYVATRRPPRVAMRRKHNTPGLPAFLYNDRLVPSGTAAVRPVDTHFGAGF